MSDLYAGNLPGATLGRPQNEGDASQPRLRTPQQVMADRRARDARRAEQEALRQRQAQDEELRRRQGEEISVGVAEDASSRRPTTGRRPAQESQSQYQTPQSGITIGRRPENIPATNGGTGRAGITTVNPNQPRPVSVQAAEPPRGSQVQRDRTEAYEKLSMPAVAGSKAPQPQATNYPQPSTSAIPPSSRPGFPHAFERWETLSSHWEGLTSYWIRKLQENTNELEKKPIEKQMARQIEDLTAAGANLFHAVVELQRLRASSERKFQRWFFETRNEQEQSQERIAELERQLRVERETHNQGSASIEAVRAEKNKADELVREMRRELQISKEEARRAWEELGRREQEERERTIALRSGEPTIIGGVQVVPTPGMPSRHTTIAQRPQTRDGPYPGGPGPNTLSGQQPRVQEPLSRSQTTLDSPSHEQSQFIFHPEGTSPTGTDPFTEASRANEPPQLLRHEPDTQFYSSTTPRSQPQAGSAATASRTTASPARGQPTTTGQYMGLQPPMRTGTAGTDLSAPSYIPSTVSGAGSSLGEEEYHINPDGTYTRDAQGRRIPYTQPIGGYEEYSDDEDDEDHTADIEREQMYSQQYSQRQQPRVSSGNIPPPSNQPNVTSASRSSYSQVTSPQTNTQQQSRSSPATHSQSSTVSPITPRMQPTSPPNQSFDGADYNPPHTTTSSSQTTEPMSPPTTQSTGWEAINVTPRHRHPTRLSDILEERTTASRSSYLSGGAEELNVPTSSGNGPQQHPGGGATRR